MSGIGLRGVLLELLAGGVVMTTAELVDKVAGDDRFAGAHLERVYRQLDLLARHGEVRRVRHPGRRHVSWVRSQSSELAGEER